MADGDFQRAQRVFIDEMGRFFETYGASEIMGRIAGLLMFATRPMSLQEIAETLGLSKAAVSIHVRALEGLNLCRKLPKGSDRRDYYVIENNFGEALFAGSFKKLEYGLRVADKALAALPDPDQVQEPERERYRLVTQRLKEYRDFIALFDASVKEIYQKWQTGRKASKEKEERA